MLWKIAQKYKLLRTWSHSHSLSVLVLAASRTQRRHSLARSRMFTACSWAAWDLKQGHAQEQGKSQLCPGVALLCMTEAKPDIHGGSWATAQLAHGTLPSSCHWETTRVLRASEWRSSVLSAALRVCLFLAHSVIMQLVFWMLACT